MIAAGDFARIPDRWLRIVRVAWVLLAILVIVPRFLPIAPAGVPSADVSGAKWPNWTVAETYAAYAELGLTPEDFLRLARGLNQLTPLMYIALAVFIFWRRSDDWVALLASVVFLTFIGSPFGQLRGNPLIAFVDEVLQAGSSLSLILLFSLFPNGRLVPRWMAVVLLIEGAIEAWRVFNPAVYQQWAFVLAAPIFLTLPVAQIYRYFRASSAEERRTIKWVVFGLATGFGPLGLYLIGVFFLFPGVLSRPNGTGAIALMIGSTLWSLFVLELPLSFTIAILRSRLWDIDIIIRRTLIYGVLSGLLLAMYFGSVVVLQQLFRGITGQGSDLAIIGSTLAIAAMFIPLRNRVQKVIDHRFYRRKYNAGQVLAAFAETARDEVDLGRLTDNLASVVEAAMQPESVSVWLRRTRDVESRGDAG